MQSRIVYFEHTGIDKEKLLHCSMKFPKGHSIKFPLGEIYEGPLSDI